MHRFAKSEELFARAQQSIAAGVNSGIRKMEQPVPLYLARGEGCRLWDVDGNEFIDFQIGQGALLYGHAPTGMAEAIAEQARLGTHWAAQSELEIDVAERLQRMISSAERVRFNNSATEVVLSAFRLARAHTGRPLILKFEGHYHGWTDEGLAGFAPPPDRWGRDEEPSRLHPSQGVIPEVLEQMIVARWNDPEHLRRRVAQYHGRIAAIVFEPVLCNTGCMEPVPELIETIRALCDREKMLMIADRYGIPLRPQGPGLVFHCAILKPGSPEGPIRDYRDYVFRHDAPRWAHLRRCLLEEGVRAIERGLWFLSLVHRPEDIVEALERADRAFVRHATEWRPS